MVRVDSERGAAGGPRGGLGRLAQRGVREVVPWRARKYVRPRDPGLVLDRARGWLVDRRTGEVIGDALEVESAHPTYRTWSASRAWGLSMLQVRADQRHYVMTLELLPVWGLRDGDEWAAVRAASAAWARLAAPDRPDLDTVMSVR